MRTQTISADDLRRNFGEVKKQLSHVEFITDRGNPIGVLKSTPQIKKKLMEQTFGAWENTDLDDEELWADILKRKFRKSKISL